MRIDGILEEWTISDGMVWGRIHDDAKGRFPDGSYIHTSRVLEINTVVPQEGTIVETLNSIYRLGKKAVEEKEASEVLDQQAAAGTRRIQ